eukprot:UN22019
MTMTIEPWDIFRAVTDKPWVFVLFLYAVFTFSAWAIYLCITYV